MASRVPWRLLTGFAAVAIFVATAGYVYYAAERDSVATSRLGELKAIAEARVGEVARWREERLREARLFSRSVLRHYLLPWMAEGRSGPPPADLKDRMNLLRDTEEYENVVLADPSGTVLLAADPVLTALSTEERAVVEQALATGDAVFGEPLRCAVCTRLHLDVAAPIRDDEGRTIAVLVLVMDPERRLFPIVQAWPTPSPSAETLLVRRDGGDVLLLNRLRHVTNSALTVRFPLTNVEVPAVQAVTGRTGVFEGLDYRGVSVVSELLPVPGASWFMVAKVDRAELYREVYDKARGTFAIVLLVLVVVGLSVQLLNRRRRLELQDCLLKIDRERLAAAEEARVTLYSIGDGVIATDGAARVTRMNPVAEGLTGWSEAEARGRPLEEVFEIVNEDTGEIVESPVIRVLREGVIVGLANHTMLVARDGTRRPIADSGAPIRDGAGATSGVILVFRDQTEERVAEQVAAEAEARFRAFFENAPIGKSMTLPDGRLSAVNPALCRMLGYSAEELAERTFAAITHPDDLAESAECVRRLLAGDAHAWTMDKRYVAKDGRIVWTHVTTCLVRDAQGKPLHFLTHIEDVSEQHRLAESLEREQQNFKALWENMAAASCLDEIVYEDGRAVDYRVLDINPAFERLVGVDRSRAVGALASSLYGTPIPFLDTYVRVAETGEPAHFEAFFPPIARHLQVTASCPVRGRFSTVFTDVTERKRTEDALRASEEKFASLFRSSPDAFFLTTVPDGRIVEVNPAAERLGGCTAADLVGRTTEQLGMWEDLAMRETYLAIIRRDGRVHQFEARFRTEKGVLFDAEVSGEIVHLAGKPHFLSVIRDITERKRAEEALRASERRLRGLYEESPLGYHSLDLHGHILDVNPRWLQMLGYTREDVLGRWFGSLLDPDDVPAYRERFPAFLAAGEVKGVEYRIRRKDGTQAVVSIDGKIARHPDGSFRQTHCVLRDVTDEKRAEEERRRFEIVARQQQKLESIGTLASGVAHEINNPLNVILNFGQLILDGPSDAGEVEVYARNIVKESERVAGIVRNLLSFARQEKETHSPARISDIVERTLSLVRASLRKDQIVVECEVAEGLPSVRCRSQQIQQVLMNLLTNARDALVERFPGPSDDKLIRIAASAFSRDGMGWVRLTVEDRGGGIPPEVAGRIFDPFFTTKARDKGTGLGLSISYGIVREHLGELSYETEAGQGTRFHVDLRVDNGWTIGEGEPAEDAEPG